MIVGWLESVLIVSILILLGVVYWVYWVEKRNLAVGFIFLIIGSTIFLYLGINGLLSLYTDIGKGEVYLSEFPNILLFVLFMALTVFVTGLGVYGLVSAYRNLRTVFGILERRKRSSLNERAKTYIYPQKRA